jgi:dTDP-4-amino-4,6-dideoxygalactose transaminase
MIKKKIIKFNKYIFEKKDLRFFDQCVKTSNISSNHLYQEKCQKLVDKLFNFKNSYITNSCTSALEAAALALDIKVNDEVLIPSYTFVTCASIFANFGANIKFLDCNPDTLTVDLSIIKKSVTKKTKALIVMHYSGVALEIDKIKAFCKKKNIFLIEDAAQCIGAKYKNKYLGSFGDMATFSFHETKNISCGEGGLLVLNNKKLLKKAKIVCLKGTNRAAFEENKTKYYTWVGKGFSALASDLTCSILYSQLIQYKEKNNLRKKLWNNYYNFFSSYKKNNIFKYPNKKNFKESNYHIFFIIYKSKKIRDEYIKFMKQKGISCVFHYLPLHKSPGGSKFTPQKNEEKFIVTNNVSNRIVRLPLHNHLSFKEQSKIINKSKYFLESHNLKL